MVQYLWRYYYDTWQSRILSRLNVLRQYAIMILIDEGILLAS